MSGIIGEVGANSGILGAYPQGTIFYTDSVEYTSTQTPQDLSSNGDVYNSSNLVISVPAETVAKASKIYVAISNSMYMNANVRTGDWLAYWETNIVRTAPGSTVIIASYERCGGAQDMNNTAYGSQNTRAIMAATGVTTGTISGFDKNLGTGIHTYKLQCYKLNQQAVYGGSDLQPYGHSGSKSSIQVMAIAK